MTTEKAKIRIVYIAAGCLIAAAFAAFVIFQNVFTAKMRAAADAVDFALTLSRTAAEVTVAQEQTALELERSRWDGYAAQLETRLDARTEALLLLVNTWNPLPEDYSVRLTEVERGFQVDVRCAAALEKMLADCRADGYYPYICSAYRTQEYQQMLFDNKLMRVRYEGVYDSAEAEKIAAQSVALPGTSEHQLGLALDLLHEWFPYLNEWQENTSTQQWLMENSWRYGFILRYPNGSSDITGIIYEPWHYRYVGLAAATEIHDQGVTLEEYIKTDGH